MCFTNATWIVIYIGYASVTWGSPMSAILNLHIYCIHPCMYIIYMYVTIVDVFECVWGDITVKLSGGKADSRRTCPLLPCGCRGSWYNSLLSCLVALLLFLLYSYLMPFVSSEKPVRDHVTWEITISTTSLLFFFSLNCSFSFVFFFFVSYTN